MTHPTDFKMEEWGKTGERKNNKFSGERPGKNERYKKYEVINIISIRYEGTFVRYSPVGKDRGSFPGVSPIFLAQ